jgi:diguanylate cyclase (GGDEF)-like protein
MSQHERDSLSGIRVLRGISVRSWALWSIPIRLVVSVLAVEATAVILIGLGLVGSRAFLDHDVRLLVLICVAGVVYAEIAHDVEQTRRRLFDTQFHTQLHVNLGSIWFFAGAVVLSPAWAGVCAVVVYTHLWWRSTGERAPVYRQVFSAAVFVLASFAASAAMAYVRELGGWGGTRGAPVGIPVLVVGILVFATVNSALVAGAIAVNNPQAKVEQVLGDWDENLLEFTTLCLAGVVAAAMTINPWLVAFVLSPALVLHRAVLVRHLQFVASTDGKTGLLNSAAWHRRAERVLLRSSWASGPLAVMVLDLDHFKAVNDTHGHLAGDQVLAAVAETVRSEVRDGDLVGRFGGEEFVVLLAGRAGGCAMDLEAVADRIRRRVAALRVEIPTPDGPLTVVGGVSVSVGAAVHQGGAVELRDLLQIADTALYSAKRSGRNTVHVGSAPTPVVVEAPVRGLDTRFATR